MNSFKSAALIVLQKSKEPLHYSEITKRALESGILETEGATPEATMRAQLGTDISTKGKDSLFIKSGPGIFGLNTKKKIFDESPQPTEKEKQQDEKIAIESGFVGMAGEHLVCSELLFRGFNASIMSVDVGLDIVAVKDNQLLGIQVKTSNLNIYNAYVFDVRKVSFERHNSGNVFYIFVLHSEAGNKFLILPLMEMERKVQEKAILEVDHGKKYRVNIKIRESNVYLGNKNHEMNYFLNNWRLIK